MDNADQTRGKLKQALGDLTDDKSLQHEGKADEAAGKLKEIVKDAEHKVEELVDAAKEKFVKH